MKYHTLYYIIVAKHLAKKADGERDQGSGKGGGGGGALRNVTHLHFHVMLLGV